jgi:hypothetical protein
MLVLVAHMLAIVHHEAAGTVVLRLLWVSSEDRLQIVA